MLSLLRGVSRRVPSLNRCTNISLIPRLHSNAPSNAETVDIIWESSDGTRTTTPAPIGSSLLEVAHSCNVPLEGACEGSIACSTCHVILEPNLFNSLEEASEEEDDMLDMAFGLTTTSRLGCQVIVDKSMENTIIKLPSATRNFAVDGFVPTPH